jgi:hypothetical protein
MQRALELSMRDMSTEESEAASSSSNSEPEEDEVS